jgi:hypothetical protein
VVVELGDDLRQARLDVRLRARHQRRVVVGEADELGHVAEVAARILGPLLRGWNGGRGVTSGSM